MFEERGFWLEDCCDSPDIRIVESSICEQKRICCFNCNEIAVGNRFLIDEDIIGIWNDMITERGRKKRTIVKVDSIDYSYPFAIF